MKLKEASITAKRKQSNNRDFEGALALARLTHQLNGAARILSDSGTAFPINKREIVAGVIREIDTLEQKLKDLGANHEG